MRTELKALDPGFPVGKGPELSVTLGLPGNICPPNSKSNSRAVSTTVTPEPEKIRAVWEKKLAHPGT